MKKEGGGELVFKRKWRAVVCFWLAWHRQIGGANKIVDFSTWPESVKADNWLEMQAPRSSWRQMGASWCQMGASWRQMGASRRKICASWRQMGFGGHWEDFGKLREGFGELREGFGRLWETSGTNAFPPLAFSSPIYIHKSYKLPINRAAAPYYYILLYITIYY